MFLISHQNQLQKVVAKRTRYNNDCNQTKPVPPTQFKPVVGKLGEERERHLEILKKLSKKSEVLDTTKAVNKFIAAEQER